MADQCLVLFLGHIHWNWRKNIAVEFNHRSTVESAAPFFTFMQFHADQMGNYETKLAKLFRSLWNHLAMKKEENILITYTCHHCFSIHWKIWLTILNFCWYKLCIKTTVKFNFRTSSYNFSQFWHSCHTTNITIHLSLSIFNTIYQWGNVTTYELHSSSRPMAFVPLLKN